jgi:hypothetical protein
MPARLCALRPHLATKRADRIPLLPLFWCIYLGENGVGLIMPVHQ